MRQLKISKSITNRDSASLEKYLYDISREKMITAEEEILLAVRIRQGDQEALKQLTTANLRFVVSVAKQYQNQGLSLLDLINEGNIGLIKAAGRFDETRGFKFISYAVWWIRQGIMQAIAEQSRMIRLPLNKVGAIVKIKKVHAVLEQKLERAPTLYEISEVLPLQEKDLEGILSASSTHLSMDSTFDDQTGLKDLLPDANAPQPDDELMSDSRSIEVQRILDTLTFQQKEIICMFYGIGTRAHTLEEIGAVYELTRERVRQIKQKAIRHLQFKSKNQLLRSYLG
jgi:RNA polymerase primary sigma factor